MRSSPESVAASHLNQQPAGGVRAHLVHAVSASWAFCAYFPVGVMYLNLLLMLLALALSPQLAVRLHKVRRNPLLLPITIMVGWTFLAAAVGDWLPDTGTRLCHVTRVGLLLILGLMLTPSEVRTAFVAFLTASMLAALVVAVHHVWGLPAWDIWGSLLTSRNNFSSGNMISMATAFGICLFLALRQGNSRGDVLVAGAAALVLGVTVALHAESRNAHLLLPAQALAAVLFRFRSAKALVSGVVAVVVLVATLCQLSPIMQLRFSAVVTQLQATETEADYSTSVGVRVRMYQEAIQGMAKHPLFGTGVGSWLPHWRSMSGVYAERLPEGERKHYTEINNPHNDFLLAGMETGVPGLMAMAWLLWRCLRHGWAGRTMSGGFAVVMSVTLIGTALVNAPLRDAALGMTLLWLLGVSIAGHRRGLGMGADA